MKNYIALIFFCLLLACNSKTDKNSKVQEESPSLEVTHARGFALYDRGDYKLLEVSEPWPEAEKTFRYALLKKGQQLPDSITVDATVSVPLESIVVTSTTHIPSLEMLGVENRLVGFPNLDFISSQKTRNRIDQGKVMELGQNESINTEMALELNPDAVVTFGVEGRNKAMATLENADVPILYNGDWVETDPLGKAEWIKFFGVLFGKEKRADSLFNDIVSRYERTKKIADQALDRPTVLSGAMFKDIWFLPQGDSWPAKLIKDAHGKYLWSETQGTGSISLNIESVLDKAQKAQFWIGPGQFTSYPQMENTNDAYALFEAFHNRKVYTFAANKGATGGLLYYELAPNRPDLVLQDIVKILHPQLLPDHNLEFFTALEE